MKVLAVILLCAFVAVQGRGTGSVANSRALAALGDQPGLVHLRIARVNTGLLSTCGGSLISNSWVLSTASCLRNARFIWVRYGVVNVVHPSLVTETSAVRLHSSADVGLASLNRNVEPTPNIAPWSLAGVEFPTSANFCAFGDNGSGGPGELLSCWDISLEAQEDGSYIASGEVSASQFDVGSALVSGGAQVGVLIEADGSNGGVFLDIAPYVEWISTEQAR